ncbi:MAG: hypothetical protein R3211_11725 [Balneolaceae bacterium]|nr:hypothetical protein [Balneolaceae bacterium]
MSILIADSGATKTEWCLCKNGGVSAIYKTEGLNPYYHTTQSIRRVLEEHLVDKLEGEELSQIYFYGAGCDSEDKNQVVKDALESVFAESEIHVYHDLLGAARACFFHDAGIACILGTGSNSCLYDGNKIAEHIPSLAFILGDEGSAGYFGKKIINSYFRFEVPEELKKDLEANYNMSLDYINEGLYDNPQKSRFIASYGSFLGDHKDHPFIASMLREGFENFITRIVMKYTDARKYEVRFIGSVAHAHQEMIKEILQENKMKPGMFVQKPMERLVEFHTS